MLELMFCSLLTIVPDYLYRRYAQGKRLGKEITFYSVWFELRWGITACLVLTVSLITVIFYNHPSTTNVTLFLPKPVLTTKRYVGMLTLLSFLMSRPADSSTSSSRKRGSPNMGTASPADGMSLCAT